MLKHLSALCLAVVLMGSPAFAQNSGEISKVKTGTSCAGCNLFQAELAYTDTKNLNLKGARLRQANLSLVTYDDANLSGANLTVANLFGARFNRCDFRNANLSNTTAVGTYFGASTLSGANLSAANLSGANLTLAQGLTQGQLNQACGDDTTRLPAGRTIPRCR